MTCINLEIALKYIYLMSNLFNTKIRSSHCGSVVTNLTSIHEDAGSIPVLAQWVKNMALSWAVVSVAEVAQIPSCCGCGNRPAAAAPIQLLAWELPYAMWQRWKEKKKSFLLSIYFAKKYSRLWQEAWCHTFLSLWGNVTYVVYPLLDV